MDVKIKKKPRPPRVKVERFCWWADTYEKAVQWANRAQLKGYRTLIEGQHPYWVWWWKKPVSKRADHVEETTMGQERSNPRSLARLVRRREGGTTAAVG